VRPGSIVDASKLQDGWFAGGTAAQLMDRLARRPDGVLASVETVHDFQLRPGDLLRLRLQDGRTKQFRTVAFHYVGVAKEFPTAPKDSFLVANERYVARATGTDAVGAFLVRTDGMSPATVARRMRAVVGTGARVTDIVAERNVVGSNLTAVEMSGLTRVELAVALVLAVAASGLALGVGFHERRRTFAVAAALGARSRQLGGFVWGESVFVTAGGAILGTFMVRGTLGDARAGAHRRLRPAARHARGALRLPRSRPPPAARRRGASWGGHAPGAAAPGRRGAARPVGTRALRSGGRQVSRTP
jgi:putative ABC transport system permease protein